MRPRSRAGNDFVASWLFPTIPPKPARLQFVTGVSTSLRRKNRQAKTTTR
jgi:hypothetical protein